MNRLPVRALSCDFAPPLPYGVDRPPAFSGQGVSPLFARWRAFAVMCCIATSPAHGASDPATAAVYRAAGTAQCANAVVELQVLASPLRAAGIAVRASRCASDGLMRKMLCGSPDGRLAVFDIRSKDVAAASKLGFAPLNELPDAQEVACQ